MDPMEKKGEIEIRRDLAAAYRLVDRFGMSELIYNHISARLPGPEHHFLINPFGLMYREITSSNLVKIDLEGNLVDPAAEKAGVKINPAGFIIHSAIHQKRPDIMCILHTHTLAGMGVAALREGLIPIVQESLRFYHRVAYHEFAGIVLDPAEKESLIHSLGDKNILILRNHGLLTLGRSVAQAFGLMYYLERACRIQLSLLATEKEPILPPPDVCEKTAAQHWGKVEQLEELLWPALLRLLDREDPSYRD